MKLVIPATLAIIFLLLYFNFKSVGETLIVMLSLPFALVGGIWFVWALGYNWSVAVAIGFIALSGVAAETGVVMLIYLDHAWKARQATRVAEGRQPTLRDLYEAVMEGRGGARATQDDDGDGDHGRPAADSVGEWHRRQRDEAHRRADGGRHDLEHGVDAGRHPGRVLAVEGLQAAQPRAPLVRANRSTVRASRIKNDWVTGEQEWKISIRIVPMIHRWRRPRLPPGDRSCAGRAALAQG